MYEHVPSPVKHEGAGARQISLIVHRSLSEKKAIQFSMLLNVINEVRWEIRKYEVFDYKRWNDYDSWKRVGEYSKIVDNCCSVSFSFCPFPIHSNRLQFSYSMYFCGNFLFILTACPHTKPAEIHNLLQGSLGYKETRDQKTNKTNEWNHKQTVTDYRQAILTLNIYQRFRSQLLHLHTFTEWNCLHTRENGVISGARSTPQA